MAYSKDDIHFLEANKLSESERLNEQYAFMKELTGGSPLHPSIPKDKVFAIADIATGTGVWLRDIHDHLQQDTSSVIARSYYGFDIFSATFPSEPGDLHFSVHNVLEPFPSEYLNRFDLVHISLLSGALKEADFKTVSDNALSLLKPGGYIQWHEGNMGTMSQTRKEEYPRLSQTIELFFGSVLKKGVIAEPTKLVHRSLQEAGFQGVVTDEYSTLDNPQLKEKSQRWVLGPLQYLPRVMLMEHLVPDADTAQVKADAILDEIKGDFINAGVQPVMTMGIMTGKKPE